MHPSQIQVKSKSIKSIKSISVRCRPSSGFFTVLSLCQSRRLPQTLQALPPPTHEPLSHFLNMTSFYDVLGVNLNATPTQVKKAFYNLALLYHPDKGGDADVFKFLSMVSEVLQDKKRRADYDLQGKAAFMAGWDYKPPSGEKFEEGELVYQFILEPINVSHSDIQYILSTKGAAMLKVKSDRWSETQVEVGFLRNLYLILKRRSEGFNNMVVVWRRDSKHKFTQMDGRWYSGVHTLDGLDVPEQCKDRFHEDIAFYNQTTSLFELPRLFKELFRLGLNIQDLDQPKAFPTAMISRHPWSVHLRRWVEAPESNLKVT